MGTICGAKMINYLLERTRIVTLLGPQERNYHVFYELFYQNDRKLLRSLYLDNKSPGDFACLGDEDSGRADEDRVRVEDVSLARIRSSLSLLDISSETQSQMLQILAVVLHASNVFFSPAPNDGSEVSGPSLQSLQCVTSLLAVDQNEFLLALTVKTSTVRSETFKKPLDPPKAKARLEAVARYLYSSLFTWLVTSINKTISNDQLRRAFIGLLDIYGFESLEENSLEQLLINYANETLQRIFNATVFEFEQEQYKSEGIDFSSVTFADNRQTLDLIENGILALLDDVWHVSDAQGKGDQKLLSQYHKRFGGWSGTSTVKSFNVKDNFEPHPRYMKPRLHSDSNFAIVHYAGMVTYQALGFCEKNRENLDEDLNTVIATARNPLVTAAIEASHAFSAGPEKGGGSKRSNGRARQDKIHGVSVAMQFKSSLRKLVVTIASTKTLYVRCIKPNPRKDPDDFVPPSILLQLKYSGMFEAVRIRQQGYSTRISHGAFVHRFGPINPKARNLEDLLKTLQSLFGVTRDDWQIGRTRIFLKASFHRKLDRFGRLRMRLAVARIIRAYVEYRRRNAAFKIVTWYRMTRARYYMRRTNKAAKVVQACARMWKAKMLRRRRMKAVLKMQAVMRGAHARRAAQEQSNPYGGKRRSVILFAKSELEAEVVRVEDGAMDSEDEKEIMTLKKQIKKAADAAEMAVGNQELDDMKRPELLAKRYAADAELNYGSQVGDFDVCASAQTKLADANEKLALVPSVMDVKEQLDQVARRTTDLLEAQEDTPDFSALAALRREGMALEKKLEEVKEERTKKGYGSRIADPDDPTEWAWLSMQMRYLRESLAEKSALKQYAECSHIQRVIVRMQAIADEVPPAEELEAAHEETGARAEAAKASRSFDEYGRIMVQLKVLEAKQQLRVDLGLDAPPEPEEDFMAMQPDEIFEKRGELQAALDKQNTELQEAMQEQDFAKCSVLQQQIAESEATLAKLPTVENLREEVQHVEEEISTKIKEEDYESCEKLQEKLAARRELLQELESREETQGLRARDRSSSNLPDGEHAMLGRPSTAGRTSASDSDAEEKFVREARKINKLRVMEPIVLTASQTVFDACRAMVSGRQTCALVVDGRGALCGILTDKDITGRCVAQYLDPANTVVGDIMTSNPKFVDMEETAGDALNMMIDGHFRHLPVVDQSRGGAVTGVIDIARVLYDALKRIEGEVLPRDAEAGADFGRRLRADSTDPADNPDDPQPRFSDVSVDLNNMEEIISAVHKAAANGGELEGLGKIIPLLTQLRDTSMAGFGAGYTSMSRSLGVLIDPAADRPVVFSRDNVRSACQAMARYRRAVLVEDDDGFLLGIVTPTDILKKVINEGISPDVTAVTSVMTENPDTATRETTFKDALHMMHDNKYLHVPVVAIVPGLLGGPQKRALGCVDVVEIICGAFGRNPPRRMALQMTSIAAVHPASPHTSSIALPAAAPAPRGSAFSVGSDGQNTHHSRGLLSGYGADSEYRDVPTPVSTSPSTPFLHDPASMNGSIGQPPPPSIYSGVSRHRLGYGISDADSDVSYSHSLLSSGTGLGYGSASTAGVGFGRVPFKVSFTQSSKKHRFNGPSTDLHAVIEKVRIKADLAPEVAIRLQYVDEDEDHVEIKSDEDLREAVESAIVRQRRHAVRLVALIGKQAVRNSLDMSEKKEQLQQLGNGYFPSLTDMMRSVVGVSGLAPDVVVGIGVGVSLVAVVVGFSMLSQKKASTPTYSAVPRARHMYLRRR
eukprot:scaffold5143_cov231-Pinguiococcus_pyrenoidosus.AAC.10